MFVINKFNRLLRVNFLSCFQLLILYIMPYIEHIQSTRSREDGSPERNERFIGYLQGRLSPIDIKSIVSINDHKGSIEVTMDKRVIDLLNSETDGSQQTFIERIIKEAWDSMGEGYYEFFYEYQEGG